MVADYFSHPRVDSPPRGRRWVVQTIGWDGGLPVAVAVAPELLRLLGFGEIAVGFCCIGVLPAAAGLIRAHFGQRQLAHLDRRERTGWRQVVFGLALCVLMFFDVYLGVIQIIAGPIPPLAWGVVAGSYLLYLSLILTAVRPPGEFVGPQPGR